MFPDVQNIQKPMDAIFYQNSSGGASDSQILHCGRAFDHYTGVKGREFEQVCLNIQSNPTLWAPA